MTDLEWDELPERPMLRRAIRHRLRSVEPTMRVFAEDFLAESSRIDLLAVGGEGELVALRIGRGDDDALLTHGLSDIGWLRPRIADFSKLAPALGLERSAEPRAILVCPEFTREIRSAVSVLPACTVGLMTYHALRERGQLRVLLDVHDSPRTRRATQTPPLVSDESGAPRSPVADQAPATIRSARPSAESRAIDGFRTGLSDADLGLEGLEEKQLE